MIILGIDPGIERLGYAVVEKNKGKDSIISSGCIITKKEKVYPKRLLDIARKIKKIISQYKPHIIAVEKVFFTSNQKTVMQVSEVRGIILYLAAEKNIPIKELTPLQIKYSLTGYGRAEKDQVKKMVLSLTKTTKKIKYDDEIDAMAVALSCPNNLLNLSTVF